MKGMLDENEAFSFEVHIISKTSSKAQKLLGFPHCIK